MEDKLISKLENLANIDLTQALNLACIAVENEAKKNCPVDDGQLRQSITHEIEGNEAWVGTNVFYAPYVEYGTGVFAAEGNGRADRWSYQDEKGEWHSTIGQKPKPFLMPALDANRNTIKQLLAQAIRKEIEK